MNYLTIRIGCSEKYLGFREEVTEGWKKLHYEEVGHGALVDKRTAHKSLDRKWERGEKKKQLGRPTLKQILRDTKCNDVVSLAQDNDK